MVRHAIHTLLAVGLVALAAPPAGAQAIDTSQTPAGFGWTLTPSLLANTAWDDNALVRGQGDDTISDLVNIVNPRLEVDFRGRRGDFNGAYDGAFRLYRTLNDLNSYDQNATVSGRRFLSKHVSIFGSNQIMTAPTTEQLELVGVPYIRTGSTSAFLRAGVDATLSKRLSLVASYNFEAVRFEQAQSFSYQLVGGHSHGGSLLVRRALAERTSLIADYGVQQATVGNISDAFEIHHAEGGIEHQLTDRLRISAAAGISHLSTTIDGVGRTGPSWRGSITRQFEAGTVDVAYSRAFVPSYGFGGTQQNEEIRAAARVPFGRTLYTQSSLAWRRNEPLIINGLKLKTLVVEASVGYMLAPWVGVEGFFDSSSQRLDMPGGASDHHRIGVQIVTTKPMRIR